MSRARQEVVIEEKLVGFNGIPVCRKYSRGKLLGKGGFAKCYELREIGSDRLYAGKVVAKSSLTKSRAKQKLLAEIQIHRSLSHPHVVRFERYFEDKENVCILLELCRNQTMMELVKRRGRLTDAEVHYYMFQIIGAVKYLHAENVIHRDLKLGNLFLGDNMDVKIGDFGLATKVEFDGERKRTICGTPNYIAPEILDGRNGHSFEVDVWSLGVILYTLLVGKPPFETSDVKATYKRIRSNQYDFPDHIFIQESAKDLIRRILHPSPERRPTLADILNHTYFRTAVVPKSLPPSALPPPVCAPAAPKAGPLRQPLRDVRIDDPRLSAPPATAPPATGFELDRDPYGITRPAPAPPASRIPDPLPPPTAPPATAGPALGAGSAATATGADVDELRAVLQQVRLGAGTTAREREREKEREAAALAATEKENRPLSAFAPPPVAATSSGAAPGATERAGPIVDEELEEEERTRLHDLHQQLEASFAAAARAPPAPAPAGPAPGPSHAPAPVIALAPSPSAAVVAGGAASASVWVTKWVDYSTKYGLGYRLSNGCVGVFFNDATKIILAPDGSHVEYMERRRASPGAEARDERRAFLLGDFPKELTKKVTLLKHFRNYLAEHSAGAPATPPPAPGAPLVYVKKWLRTRHAAIFRLSNKTIQVNFYDHTEMLLCGEARCVSYVNKARERVTYSLASVPNSPDLLKRLKYTKEILYQLIARTPGAGTATQGPVPRTAAEIL